MQVKCTLAQEIREINWRLVDTVVDISEEEVNSTCGTPANEGSEGTIVRCSFNAVTINPDMTSEHASAIMVCCSLVDIWLCEVIINFVFCRCKIYLCLCGYAVASQSLVVACSKELSRLLPYTPRQVASRSQVRDAITFVFICKSFLSFIQ